MKKKLLLIFLSVVGVLGLSVGLGYQQLKSKMPELFRMALQEAHSKGIEISFQQVIPPQDALIDLKDIKISGKTLKISVAIDTLKVKLSLKPSFHPLNVFILVTHPSFSKPTDLQQPPDTTSYSPVTESQNLKGWMAAALIFSSINLSMSDIEASPLGIKRADLMLSTKGASLAWAKPISWALIHRFDLKEWTKTKFSLLPKFLTEGEVLFNWNQIALSNTKLSANNLNILAAGKYDLQSQKWNLDLEIPRVNLKQADPNQLKSLFNGISSAEGTVYFKATSQGLGSNLNSIYTEGELQAKRVLLQLVRPDVNGKVAVNINSTFSKKGSLVLDTNLDINLDETEINVDHQFKKPARIPLNAEVKISGRDDQYNIEKGVINFHNLTTKVKGTVLNGPKISTRIEAAIANTVLNGWEQFLPSLANIKTTGSIEGALSYAGTIDDWKLATVDLLLKAKNIEVPILQDWISHKDLSLSGKAKLNTDTNVSISQGTLKNLRTSTQVNLTESKIRFGEQFSKDNNTPLTANLNVESNSKEAKVKSSSFLIGPVHGKIEGKISQFHSPNVELKLETIPVEAKSMSMIFPPLKESTLSIKAGTITSKASIVGPILLKETKPTLNLQTSIHRLSVDYYLDPKQMPIEIRDVEAIIKTEFGPAAAIALQAEPMRFKLFNGDVSLNLSCKGPIRTAHCLQKINFKNLSANKLLDFIAPKSSGLVRGRLNLDFAGEFTGLNVDSSRKSLVGKGTFSLLDGEFLSVNLANRALDGLKRIPVFASFINSNIKNQTLKETTGIFEIKDGKTLFSEVKILSPYFEVRAPLITLDTEQKIYSKIIWTPKESLLNKSALEMIKDASGTPAIPLTVQGPATQPSISIDEAVLQGRIASFTKRMAEQKTTRSLSDFKNKIGSQIQQQLKKGLEGIFKR